MPTAQPAREHKDSLFKWLFGTPQEVLSLYSAVTAKPIPPDTAVELVTLTDVLYTNQINDIAALIGDVLLVLVEHQSTISDNLPLRLLMYAGRLYEKLTDKSKRYQRSRIIVPKPQFIVLYNGASPYPDHTTLKLSDAYSIVPPELQNSVDAGSLELTVDIYNINYGHNSELLLRDQTLNGYAQFIGKVREEFSVQRSDLPYWERLNVAIRAALDYCERANILQPQLTQQSSEVLNMLTAEWDPELYKATVEREAREEWWQKGVQEGRQEGRQEGILHKAIEIALRLIKRKLPISEISEVTGLSESEIERLTNERC